jgi:hypothetical protein
MTIGSTFICPECKEQVFHLKYQLDTSIKWRSWPFSLACDTCGNVIDGTLDSQGVHIPNFKEVDPSCEGKVFAYSNTLPTPSNLFYQPWKGCGISSIFINLSALVGPVNINRYGANMYVMESGLVRYKNSLSALFPLLRGRGTNVKAFKNKLRDVMGLKPTEVPNIQTANDCYDLFHEFHNTILIHLNNNDCWVEPVFKKISSYVEAFSSDDIQSIIRAVSNNSSNFLSKMTTKIYSRLNINLNELQKLLPAFFLEQDFVKNILPDDSFRLVTASFYDIETLYADNYNLLVQYLPLLLAIYNLAENGDIDKFETSDANVKGKTISDFIRLSDGSRVNVMSKLSFFKDALEEAFNNRVRDGIIHQDQEYEFIQQTVKYYYDGSNRDKMYESTLIRLTHMCIMQFRWITHLCCLMWQLKEHEI